MPCGGGGVNCGPLYDRMVLGKPNLETISSNASDAASDVILLIGLPQ